MSTGTTFTGVPIMQLDDNLSNGRTYTFQFKCANWFCLSDLSGAMANDIVSNAPDFITSLGVTSPFTTSLYNVQFTYEGDGSDVVSDVAYSIIAAVKAGSNDDITFIGAVAASAPDIVVTPTVAAKATEQAVVGAAKGITVDVTQAAVGAASDAVNKALVGILPLLIVVVVIVLYVLPSFAGSVSKIEGR